MPGPQRNAYAKPKNAKHTFLRLMRYLKKYSGLLAIIIPSLIISSAASVLGTYLLKPLFNQIAALFEQGGSSMLPVLGTVLALAGIYALGALGTFVGNRLLINVATGILETVRCEMFDKLQTLPIKYFDTRTHGEIMSRFTNDTDAMREMLGQGLPQLIVSTISVVGVLTMMLILTPLLTLIVLVMFVLMLVIVKFVGKRSSHFFARRQAALAAANGYAEEMIEGQREVKVFCHEEKVEADFSVLAEGLRRDSTAAMTFAMILMPIMGNLSYVLYAVSAAAGAGLAISGMMDIGTIAAFLQYTRQFTNPLTQISQQFNSLLNALAGAERIFELIDGTPEIDDGNVTMVYAQRGEDGMLLETDHYTGLWAWKVPDAGEPGGFRLVELRGDVRFDHVTFAYEEGHDVLRDVSLYAKPGQKIAFVGSTGAGKTTITNLINRFYDVQHGRITYDGIDVKDIRKSDLRRSLSMVLQDTHLFTGTVRDNIRYGNLHATDEEIEAAAKLANAHFFITHLPQGYDTVLTGDGANLSQGQRQLLAIARAAVANAPVLILDEATSSIDTRTERLIEMGMDRLMAGRTVFVIAHRLSTVRNSNAIMVLEHGQIIERGDHDDLLEQKGKYYQLYMGMFELS